MATEQINTYDPADNSPEALMDTVDEQRTGYVALSLTEYATTTVPAIAIGSEIEINGALFKTLDSTDPVTVGGVADGTVYILATPSGVSPAQIVTFSFTATAPTWFDSKQGFYNAGGTARYVGFAMTKATASYSAKKQFFLTNNDDITFGADGDIITTGGATLGGSIISGGDITANSGAGALVGIASRIKDNTGGTGLYLRYVDITIVVGTSVTTVGVSNLISVTGHRFQSGPSGFAYRASGQGAGVVSVTSVNSITNAGSNITVTNAVIRVYYFASV